MSSFFLRSSSFFILLGCLLSAPTNLHAEDFRLSDYILNDNKDAAELCLSFNAPLNIAQKEETLKKITLEQNEKPVPLNPLDITFTTTQFCIQKLQHGKSYELDVSALQNNKGQKLSNLRILTFSIPKRKPWLSFSQSSSGVMPSRLGTSLALESVNISDISLTLFKISDPSKLAAAWNEFQQVNLTPTESLTFAQNNGEVVWKEEKILKIQPHQLFSEKIDIPEQTSGLYFLAAIPKDMPNGIAIDPKLMTGRWLIKSALTLSALHTDNFLFVFANEGEKPNTFIKAQIFNKEGTLLKESQTNSEGTLKLSWAASDETPSLVVATNKEKEIAFAVVEQRDAQTNNMIYTLKADRSDYSVGDQAVLHLKAESADGRITALTETSLRLVRPDHSIERDFLLPEAPEGFTLQTTAIPLSAKKGTWTFVWHQNGRVLAEQKVQINETSPIEQNYQVSFDRKNIEPDGRLSFSIHFQGSQKAFHGGLVKWEPMRPDFTAWPRYRFPETGEAKLEGASGQKPFIANEEGIAHINLTLPSNTKGAVRLSILPKNKAPFETVLSFSSPNGIIGIKQVPALTSRQVVLNLISVDSSLKRQATAPLYYQVFEEDRNFKWQRSDGRWGYQPLQQHRRVASGRTTISAKDDTLLRIPATARRYMLEVSDSNGNLLSRYPFQGPADGALSGLDSYDDSFTLLGISQESPSIKLKFNLKQPSFVSLVIQGKDIIQAINKRFPAGESTASLPAATNKEMRLMVLGQTTLTMPRGDSRVITKMLEYFPAHAEKDLVLRPQLSGIKSEAGKLSIPITAIPHPSQKNTRITGILIPDRKKNPEAWTQPLYAKTQLDKYNHGNLEFSYSPTAPYRLVLAAANETQSGSHISTLPHENDFVIKNDFPSVLVVGDKIYGSITLANPPKTLNGEYRYTLQTTAGLSIQGKTTGSFLSKNTLQIPFMITALRPEVGEVSLEITGPHRLHTTYHWPVISQKSENRPLPSKKLHLVQNEPLVLKGKAIENTLFISPLSLGPIESAFMNLVTTIPSTPQQLADWLLTSLSWKHGLESTSFVTARSFENLQNERLTLLLKNQNDNGSFSNIGDSDGEMLATAHALVAFGQYAPSNPLAEQAMLRSALWIQKKLENPWFDESLRAEFATGYWALAQTGHVDVAMLRYFADTSRDKVFSPLTSAQIGVALSLNQDQDAAEYWINRAKTELTASSPDSMTWDTLSLLATTSVESSFFDSFLKAPHEDTSYLMPSYLRMLWSLAEREGTWTLSIDGESKKRFGIAIILPQEKSGTRTLLNTTTKNLFVSITLPPSEQEVTDISHFMQTHLYQLDGGRLNETDALKKDSVYVFELSGPTPQETPFIIQHILGSGFEVLAPNGVIAEVIEQKFPWLGSDLTRWSKFKSNGQTVTFHVLPADEKVADFWRVAYIVRAARNGRFSQQTPTLHTQQTLGVSTKAAEYKIQ